MTTAMFDHLQNWFLEYTAGFLRGDKIEDTNYLLKRHHTLRVVKNSRLIAESLGLSEEDKALAQAAAIFHDVGRFKQYQCFGTFNDRKSLNHAKLGLEVFTSLPIWKEFPQSQREILAPAVRCHNAARIPDELDQRQCRFAKLLRDADKLDIWLVVTQYYRTVESHSQNSALEQGMPDRPTYSPDVIAALRASRFVKAEDMQTLNDFKLMQVSWVYDLNFKAAFQMVLRRRFLDKLQMALPADDTIKEVITVAKAHVERLAQA